MSLANFTRSTARTKAAVRQSMPRFARVSESGDSQTPPEVVADWYERRGYDFIVFTDHNVITIRRTGRRCSRSRASS